MLTNTKYVELNSFSAHIINDEKRMSFSKREYSLFKYGSKTHARKFGKDLANAFIKSKQFITLVTEYKDKQIVVCSSPYQFVPTATFAMKDYFIQTVNTKLVELDVNPIEEIKIHRKCSYITDYGSMNAEERKKSIYADGFHIDRELVKDKFVLFLDDIKITGAHEMRVRTLIDDYGLECDYSFLYFAKLNIDTNPQIESALNLYAIDSLLDINYIIRNLEFQHNTRVTKYILKSDQHEFKSFIDYQSETFKETLYRNSIGNGYHNADAFKENLLYLQSVVST